MSRLKTKSLSAALAVAALAVMGISASAASAAPAAFNIPANSNANVKVSGTLTVNEGPSPKVNCTFTNALATAYNNGSPSQGTLFLEMTTTCANGKALGISAGLSGIKNGSVFTVKNLYPSYGQNPIYGGWWQSSGFEVPWTNGSGATASKITFNNTIVSQGGHVLAFTGSLNVSKADGSLLLLS